MFVLILVGAFAVNQIRDISSKATISNQSLTTKDSTAVASTAKPAILLPTPLVAQYGSVLIHLPVTTKDLTEVAFHQASYAWALVMETQLASADAEAAYNRKGTARTADQPTGNAYMDGPALHLWRSSATTEMDTSVDCGAAIGKTVYAPVTGTVVLIAEYNLFETLMDYEIHIQPTGHPELDVVVLHTTDPKVKAGDKVKGGATPISVIRDITAVSGLQLEPYTAGDDPGCHAHVQVNNTNYEGYRENKLVGAITAS